jgi:hypothetical protein
MIHYAPGLEATTLTKLAAMTERLKGQASGVVNKGEAWSGVHHRRRSQDVEV